MGVTYAYDWRGQLNMGLTAGGRRAAHRQTRWLAVQHERHALAANAAPRLATLRRQPRPFSWPPGLNTTMSRTSLHRRTLAGLLAAGLLRPELALAQPRARRRDADAPARPYARRDDAMRWADDVALRRNLDAPWVRDAIGQAVFVPSVARLILPPPRGTAKNWRVYRSRFIDPVRIRAGARFWERNRTTLARAQAEFGVPPEIIVGIVGVETIYGQNMGSFRVIDALATLTFDFPATHPRAEARQAFFQGELEQFLSLCQRHRMDPLAPLGSYAGAMGMPQFMPSSWTRYAIDFDGDGPIDLWNSEADVIGSVANYFVGHGWRPGLPTHYPVQLAPEAEMDALLAPDILPSFSVASFVAKGAVLNAEGREHPGQLALIELQNGDPSLPDNEPNYVAGTENFYVITRYNWSAYYAMAVIDLGQEVAAVLAQGR